MAKFSICENQKVKGGCVCEKSSHLHACCSVIWQREVSNKYVSMQ